jgi:hypothetical protein
MANKQRDVAKERWWRELVERQSASGLSARAFCRREELSEASFYAWRRTIVQRDVQRASVQACPAFVPVAVTGSLRAGFVVELSGGRVLRLPETIPLERLAEFVVALESRGGR